MAQLKKNNKKTLGSGMIPGTSNHNNNGSAYNDLKSHWNYYGPIEEKKSEKTLAAS